MPHAEKTAATDGTTTRWISRSRATSVTCRPAAPPKATSANWRGSRDALRRPQRGRAELGRDELDGRARRARIEPDAAAEEVPRVEEAQHEVRVGHRRARPSLSVARGARLGAGALGPEVEDSARVHPCDRSAAGAEGVDVDRRERDLRDADGLLARELGLAALQERDVRGRPAHVEGDEVRLAQEPRAVAAGGDAAGRPRQHGARRQPRRLAYRRDAAVRLHDQDVTAVAVAGEPGGEARQVAREGRPHVRVHDGRPHALVFLDLRQDLGRERHVGARQAPGERASGQLLVARVPVRVEIADGDRLHPRLRERRDPRLEGAGAQRNRDRSVEAQSLADAQAAGTRYERDGRRHPQVVAVVLQPLAHLDDVAVPLGREKPDLRSFALEEGVGRDGGAVDDRVGLGEQPVEVRAELRRQEPEPGDQPLGGVRRRRGALGDGEGAALVHRDEVGEGAADVDPDPVASAQ